MNSKHSLALSLIVSTLAMGSITQIQAATNDVTVYSSRKEHLIQPLFQQFTKQTGIEVNYLTGSGGDLIERLKLEGENTPADMFMTVDAGDLWFDTANNTLKNYNGSAWLGITSNSGIQNVADDTSPELAAALDCNNYNLTEVGTVNGNNLQIDFGTL